MHLAALSSKQLKLEIENLTSLSLLWPVRQQRLIGLHPPNCYSARQHVTVSEMHLSCNSIIVVRKIKDLLENMFFELSSTRAFD